MSEWESEWESVSEWDSLQIQMLGIFNCFARTSRNGDSTKHSVSVRICIPLHSICKCIKAYNAFSVVVSCSDFFSSLFFWKNSIVECAFFSSRVLAYLLACHVTWYIPIGNECSSGSFQKDSNCIVCDACVRVCVYVGEMGFIVM